MTQRSGLGVLRRSASKSCRIARVICGEGLPERPDPTRSLEHRNSDSPVFWFTSKKRKAVEGVVCNSGHFRENNLYTNQHHYLVGDRVAKLFTSSNNRGKEGEPFYKALNQALNGLVSLRTQPAEGSRPEESSSRVLAVLDFPIVVCSSFANLYSADFDGQRDPSE